MALRPVQSLSVLLLAAALLGGCSKRMDPRAEAPPPPPESSPVEFPSLAGPPPSPQTFGDAQRAEREAAADSRWRPGPELPPGLIATRVPDPNHPGRTMLIISNRPIANPEGRAHGYGYGAGHRTHHRLAGGTESGGTVVVHSSGTISAAPPAELAPEAGTPAPEAKAAAKAQPVPAPQAAQPVRNEPGSPALTASPMLWLIAAFALLIIVVLAILGGRRGKRRYSSAPDGAHRA